MLLTILIAVGAAIAAGAAAWFGLAYVMRRPALARRLVKIPPFRWVMARMTAAGMKAARRKAERDGVIPTGRPVSDLEVALAVSDTDEARHARAMLARLSPAQRNELSRRTMGTDGLAGLMSDGSAAEAEALGRANRRRVAGTAAPTGDPSRDAQRRKAVAKRRAQRKAAARR